MHDYLIVGAGLSGAVLAERLSSAGKKVVVIDKKDHIGGHCYDFHHESGVLVHKFGPHYFRTNYDEVIDYLSSFTKWIDADYIIKACVNDELYSLPINRNTLNKFFDVSLSSDEEAREFLNDIRNQEIEPKNAEEQVVA